MRLRKSLDSPLTCLLVIAIVFLVFVFGRLYLARFDLTSFIVAGDSYCDASRVPPGLTVLKDSTGFDGQFYYRLALNPLTSQREEFGITLDTPPLRHQRILYPLLAWVFSLGSPNRLPLALILINFSALCLMGWIAGAFAQQRGLHSLWGVFLPLYPGFLFTLSRDTVEILEATLVLASLYFLFRRKTLLATLFLCLAVLTKETSLIVAFAAAAVYVVERWRGGTKAYVRWQFAVAPIILFAAWQIFLIQLWVEFHMPTSGATNLTVPFAGIGPAILDTFAHHPFYLRKFIELIFLCGFGVAVLLNLRDTKATLIETMSWVLAACLVVSLGSSIWTEDWNFMRVLSLFGVLGAVVLITGKRPVKYVALGSSLLLWVLLFFKLMRSYTLG
jgi:hypothetical protein